MVLIIVALVAEYSHIFGELSVRSLSISFIIEQFQIHFGSGLYASLLLTFLYLFFTVLLMVIPVEIFKRKNGQNSNRKRSIESQQSDTDDEYSFNETEVESV